MSHQHFSAPPSEVARELKEELVHDYLRVPEDGPRKQTREEYRRLKELDELRKAGSAPAAVDERGHDINPHIPQYMVDVPWYVSYDHSRPTLKHQRIHPERQKNYDGIRTWYEKEHVAQSTQVTKYRPGACENCGALTHKRKECLERPRKVGIKFGGKGEIIADEPQLPSLNLSWDGKRDRWNGVDLNVHQYRVLRDFEGLDRKRSIQEDASVEDDKYVDEMDMPGQKIDSKQRISVRNLRIREDTAKYLLNLDPNSAYYDPKSRSMRDDPLADSKRAAKKTFFGDNFVRSTGDSSKFVESERFAWESQEKGIPIHQQADPTRLQLLHKEYNTKKGEFVSKLKESILETYGGAEHLVSDRTATIVGQADSNYLLYDRHGDLKPESKRKIAESISKRRSKYPEDVHINGHKSVFGSFYCKKEGRWGFACCKNLFKNAYCTENVK